VSLEAVERRVERAIRERGEPCNAHVDADCATLRDGLLNLAFSLDAHEPFAARLAHGDVLHRAQRLTAVAVAQPAELGQEDSGIGLIELDLFRVWIAEAVGLALFLETREVGLPGEEVGVSAF